MDRKQRVKYLEEKLSNLRKMRLHASGVPKKNLDYDIIMLKEEIKKAKDGPKDGWDMSL